MNRYVVVGAGRAGQARIRSMVAFPEMEGVQLPARSKSFQEDFQRHLSDPTVLAVLVCTANQTHFELASAALDAGKHVLVEFPLTASVDEAEMLFELLDVETSTTRRIHWLDDAKPPGISRNEPEILAARSCAHGRWLLSLGG